MARRRYDAPAPSLPQAFQDYRQAWIELKGGGPYPRADYLAAKSSRFQRRLSGVSSVGSGADYHLRYQQHHMYMLERARDYERNDMVVGQALDRVVNNVLQDGVALDPQTGDDKLNADLKARWDEWRADARQCDRAAEHTLHQMALMTLRAVIVDGDVVHLPLANEGSLEAVEAHRIRTPSSTTRNVVNGFLLDEYRHRQECWITKEEIEPWRAVRLVADVDRVPMWDADGNRQVFQVYNPKRFTQTRGITALAPIANTIGMHDDLQFSMLVKAQMSAFWTILEERDAGTPTGVIPRLRTGETSTETLEDGSTRELEGMSPGMRIRAPQGVKLKGFAPNIPNPEFFQHTGLVLSIIAVNLGIPVAVLLLDPTKTNFSGWRGAIDQARIGFRRLQQLMVELFYTPVYGWKLRQWMGEEAALRNQAAKAGIKIAGHRWNPPSWRYIEPVKDITANEKALKSRQTSPQRVCNEQGLDWDDLSPQIVDNNGTHIERACARAALINQQYPWANVDWREVADGVYRGPAEQAPSPTLPKELTK